MVEGLKVFIDHQFNEIYNGEFIRLLKYNLIEKISNAVISKSENETLDLLNNNKYDVIISTGYSLNTYSACIITQKHKPKFIQIIYDFNAEKLIELYETEQLATIISQKAKLILVANKVITINKIVKKELLELYSNAKGFNIYQKTEVLDNKIDKINIKEITRKLKYNYILVDSSLNGITLLLDDLDKIIEDIKKIKPKNYKIILISSSNLSTLMPKLQDIKEYFVILNDVTENELLSLYKYSIASVFPSSLDTNTYKISLAISTNSIIIYNSSNEVYQEYFPNCIKYGLDENIIENINKMISLKNKSKLLELQSKDM